MRMRNVIRHVIAIAALVGSAAATVAAGQAPKSAAAARESLPPISYTCPMHPEIVEDKKGTCPICKMDLELFSINYFT